MCGAEPGRWSVLDYKAIACELRKAVIPKVFCGPFSMNNVLIEYSGQDAGGYRFGFIKSSSYARKYYASATIKINDNKSSRIQAKTSEFSKTLKQIFIKQR